MTHWPTWSSLHTRPDDRALAGIKGCAVRHWRYGRRQAHASLADGCAPQSLSTQPAVRDAIPSELLDAFGDTAGGRL